MSDRTDGRFPRRFGRTAPWSLGVEEELFVVDRRTLAPARLPQDAIDGVRRKRELHASVLELATGVCSSAEEVHAELEELRRDALASLDAPGLALLASGTHPSAPPFEQEIVSDPGLREFAAYAGPAARVQYCCGLHVHVSVASATDCLAALEFVLPWLPVVLALSANSPYFDGRETGYASTRAEILARLPRSGAPPVFPAFSDWEAFAGRLVDLGLADDYTRIWWDIRPHPRLGTLEVRMADQPTRVETSAVLAALIRALVASAETPTSPADRGVYAQNRFAAQRFGAGAELIHPDGSRLATVAELTEELLERVAASARRLGDEAQLAEVERLARRSQADEQLALGRSDGLAGLASELVRRTAPSRPGAVFPGNPDRVV